MFFSVIIPVYNRPEEISVLLKSLVKQTEQDFEVILIDDGSEIKSEEICKAFETQLNLRYFFRQNEGQGFARNFGMKQAKGEFFVILDSDVTLPKNYLADLENAISDRKLDAFGGPDTADINFSLTQKAMDFAMTSVWTTGGIRGKLKNPADFQARGFNMGVSRAVVEDLGGFVDPNRGEDIEWSIRIKKAGYKLELVKESFVYHKRKSSLWGFAKQAFSFGRNRVNVSRYHPEALKLIHFFPFAFLIFLLAIPFSFYLLFQLGFVLFGILCLWLLGIFLQSTMQYESEKIGLLSCFFSIVQLSCYGIGLIVELMIKLVKG